MRKWARIRVVSVKRGINTMYSSLSGACMSTALVIVENPLARIRKHIYNSLLINSYEIKIFSVAAKNLNLF